MLKIRRKMSLQAITSFALLLLYTTITTATPKEYSAKTSKNHRALISASDFKSKMVKQHNKYRCKHDAAPLRIDEDLEKKAQDLVKKAVRDEGFDVITAGQSVYEVCASFQVIVTPRQVVKSWYDEMCGGGVDFPTNKYPQAESFTQLVWKDTQRMGIAKGVGKKDNLTCTYVAAVYRPPGNIRHFYDENVSIGNQNRDKYCNTMKRDCVHHRDREILVKQPRSKAYCV